MDIRRRIDSARKPVGVPERVAHDVLLHNFVPEAPPTPQPVMPQDDAIPSSGVQPPQAQQGTAARRQPAEQEQQLIFAPSQPAAAAPDDGDEEFRRLELARKAKQVETSMRETFRKTLLRLKRPKERHAALTAWSSSPRGTITRFSTWPAFSAICANLRKRNSFWRRPCKLTLPNLSTAGCATTSCGKSGALPAPVDNAVRFRSFQQ